MDDINHGTKISYFFRVIMVTYGKSFDELPLILSLMTALFILGILVNRFTSRVVIKVLEK